MADKKEESELEKFLKDVDWDNDLYPYMKYLNIFTILKIENTEIRHSNMLGWLLDPNGSHGLGDNFLKRIFRPYLVTPGMKATDISNLLNNWDEWTVYREKSYIDILIVSKDKDIVIVIENKTFTKDHDNQLQRYYDLITEDSTQDTKQKKTRKKSSKKKEIKLKDLSKAKPLFFYLTPEGDKPTGEGRENWICMNYGYIADALEKELTNPKNSLNPTVKLYIENYLFTIKNKILWNPELADICEKINSKYPKVVENVRYASNSEKENDEYQIIYNKNQEAFDLIFEYCPKSIDKVSKPIYDAIINLKNDDFKIKILSKGASEVRISTENIARIFQGAKNFNYEKAKWGENIYAGYIFTVRPEKDEKQLKYIIRVSLELCAPGKNEERTKFLYNIVEKIKDNNKFKEIEFQPIQELGWEWKRLIAFNDIVVTVSSDKHGTLKVNKKFDADLQKSLNEIKEFDNKLNKLFNEKGQNIN